MINTIRLKAGKELDILVKRPKHLTALIEIALKSSGVTNEVEKSVLDADDEIIEDLRLMKLVETYEGAVRILGKKVIDNTKKRGSNINPVTKKLLNEVTQDEIPDGDEIYFKIALSFNGMFKANLERLGVRTIHVENAKYDKWVTPVRLMMQVDKVKKEDLVDLYQFLQHHTFWADKVQSTEKLRKKFNTLHTQSKTDGKKGNSNTGGKAGDNKGKVSTQYLRGVLRDLQPSNPKKGAEEC